MRDEYVRAASKVIDDPNILVNVVSLRVKQLKRGNRPLVESLEKLSAEDTALREIIEGKISYELATPAEIAAFAKAISAETFDALKQGQFPIVLGGDHSLPRPVAGTAGLLSRCSAAAPARSFAG